MLTFFAVLWWVVVFPSLCTLLASWVWRRRHRPTQAEPPYSSIIGVIFAGWYGYVVTFCLFMGTGLLELFQAPQSAGAVQKLFGVEFLSALVGIATAFGGKLLANRLARSYGKSGGDDAQPGGTDSHSNLNSAS